jgi:hypothetical protein
VHISPPPVGPSCHRPASVCRFVTAGPSHPSKCLGRPQGTRSRLHRIGGAYTLAYASTFNGFDIPEIAVADQSALVTA